MSPHVFSINKAIIGAITIALLQGCTSLPVNVAPKPPAQFVKLKPVTGEGCGFLGILSTAYYFIPIGLNERVQNAYNEALYSAPGATGIIDVTISEEWKWVLLGTMRCTKISGTAIKEIIK